MECDLKINLYGGNNSGLKSGRRDVISLPVLACKIRKDY